ncbi:MAG: flagellar biosynthesis protein FlgB [Oscillibacter sp.]|nr:flagellar biosynthesis protein FlgB [Oscillibacter sp.]
MHVLTNNSMRMLEKSMDYLWAKEAAHLDNITNAETPGYKVKTVSFEETFDARLRAAMVGDRGGENVRSVIESASWKVTEDNETTRMDENGVNILEQMTEATRAAYQIQYIMRSISSNISTLHTAITG